MLMDQGKYSRNTENVFRITISILVQWSKFQFSICFPQKKYYEILWYLLIKNISMHPDPKFNSLWISLHHIKFSACKFFLFFSKYYIYLFSTSNTSHFTRSMIIAEGEELHNMTYKKFKQNNQCVYIYAGNVTWLLIPIVWNKGWGKDRVLSSGVSGNY